MNGDKWAKRSMVVKESGDYFGDSVDICPTMDIHW